MKSYCSNSKYNNFMLILLFVMLDYFAIVIAEQTAIFIRNSVLGNDWLRISWLNYWVIFPIIFLMFNKINQVYSRKMPFYKEVETLFYSCAYSTLVVILELYAFQIASSTSRLFIGLLVIFSFVFLSIFRYVVKKILIKKNLLLIPVIIIGAGKTAELLVRTIQNDAGMGYRVIGLLEDNNVQPGVLEQYPVLGNFSDAERVIHETGVKRVFIAAPGMEEQKLGQLIYRVQPFVENIGVIPNLVGVPTGGVEVESLFNEKILILRLKNNLARPLNS